MPRTPEVCPTVFCPLIKTSVRNSLSRLRFSFAYIPSTRAGFFRFIPLAALLNSSVALIHAQSLTATLSGTLTDQMGAVVPGVNIAAINIAQDFQRTAKTDEEGSFVVALSRRGRLRSKGSTRMFTTDHPYQSASK